MQRFTHVSLVLLATAALSGSIPVSASTPTRAAAAIANRIDTGPPVMNLAAMQSEAPPAQALAPPQAVVPLNAARAGTAAARTPNLQREVFGFVNAYNLGDPSVGYTTWDFSLLTTVAYFGLHVDMSNGHFFTDDTGWAVFHSSTMSNFVNLAHANGVRVIVSVNLHDFGLDPFNQVCNGLSPTTAANTIADTLTEVRYAGIDGVNINYEGTITTCGNGVTNRDELTAFAKNMRAAMPAGMYLSIDTFTGSAEDNQEFFNITGLAPYVDSFFVMAYDMDYENAVNPPLNCSSYCFNPVSALNTYRFNATSSMAQYTALVPASKVILGQPLYGRRGCTQLLSQPHQYPIPGTNFVAPTYLFASTVRTQSGVLAFAGRRDPGDGVAEWDTWYDTDWHCNRLQYFDDVESLSAKYNLVNQDNLRGVGFFTLDYGGGAPELWSRLRTYFSCPVTVTLPASETTTEFSVALTAPGCSVAAYDVQQYDATLNQGWFGVRTAMTGNGAGSALAEGYAGHSYTFRARAHNTAGLVTSWDSATTAVAANATLSHPFAGIYTMDAYGGVNATAESPPLATGAYWSGWAIARAARALPGASSPQSGAVLDGWGGLHPYGAPITISGGEYWAGWDIARDFAFLPDGSGGVVLDGWGGLHAFHVNGSTAAITIQATAYWPGWDIARKVVVFADGTGGYVMDGWGGLHPFGINGPPPVSGSKLAGDGYWPGWNIARDIVLAPGNGNHSGYVLDGWGGLHPFHPTTDGSTMPAAIASAYWSGWDIARGVWLLPGSATAGYTLDGWGGLHQFGGAPAVGPAYWPGRDFARIVFGG